jgi:hypothetical protein
MCFANIVRLGPDRVRHATSVTPAPELSCPTEHRVHGCHLVVTVARSGGGTLASTIWPYPLGAIRAGPTQLCWLDGISVANVRIGPKDDLLHAARSVSLDVSVGDVRSATMAGDTMLLMTSAGLLALSPTDAAPRLVAAESAGWNVASSERYAAWTTGIAGVDEGSVKRLDLATGELVVLAENEMRPGAIAVDRDAVYWANLGSESDGTIRTVAAGRSTPVTLATDQPAPRSIAVDGDTLYWITTAPDERRLCSVATRGGRVRELLALPSPRASSGGERLVVDRGNAYFLIGGHLGRVTSGSVVASPVATVPTGGRIIGFDIDADHVYLTAYIGPATV